MSICKHVIPLGYWYQYCCWLSDLLPSEVKTKTPCMDESRLEYAGIATKLPHRDTFSYPSPHNKPPPKLSGLKESPFIMSLGFVGQEFWKGWTEQSVCPTRPLLGSFCAVGWDWANLERTQWFTLSYGTLVEHISMWDLESMTEPTLIQGEGWRPHFSENVWPFPSCYTLQILNPSSTALLEEIKWHDTCNT